MAKVAVDFAGREVEGEVILDIEIKHYPGGYEKLYINGEDVAGNPSGISAYNVLHYLRWWYKYRINLTETFYHEDGHVLIQLDDGGDEAFADSSVDD